jgi:hypothetical protein
METVQEILSHGATAREVSDRERIEKRVKVRLPLVALLAVVLAVDSKTDSASFPDVSDLATLVPQEIRWLPARVRHQLIEVLSIGVLAIKGLAPGTDGDPHGGVLLHFGGFINPLFNGVFFVDRIGDPLIAPRRDRFAVSTEFILRHAGFYICP